MELLCPSCSTKHETSHYPETFEIQCGCGYSLLIPDEGAFQNSNTPHPLSNIATSVEAEDEALRISIPESLNNLKDPNNIDPLTDKETQENSIFTAMDMTPPEDLPEGMLYDPMELPEKNTTESAFAPSENNQPGSLTTPFNASENTLSTDRKTLIEESLLAHAGQFLGENYSLIFSGLNAEAQKIIESECQKFLAQRPWLEEVLQQNSFSFDPFVQNRQINGVPEILAVELYLLCTHLGGLCDFKKDSSALTGP